MQKPSWWASSKSPKKKKNYHSFGKTWKGYSNAKKDTLIFLFSFVVLGFMVLAVIHLFFSISDDYISTEDCKVKTNIEVRKALQLQEVDSFRAFILANSSLITLAVILIGIAWMIHGVGFTVIRR